MEIFRTLGADVTGFEPMTGLRDQALALPIHWEGAEHMAERLEAHSQDLVYSRDLLCQGVLDRETGLEILQQSLQVLRPGGLSLHQIIHVPVDRKLPLLRRRLALREQGRTETEIEREIARLERLLPPRTWTNYPLFDTDELRALPGARLIAYGAGNGELTLAMLRL